MRGGGRLHGRGLRASRSCQRSRLNGRKSLRGRKCTSEGAQTDSEREQAEPEGAQEPAESCTSRSSSTVHGVRQALLRAQPQPRPRVVMAVTW